MIFIKIECLGGKNTQIELFLFIIGDPNNIKPGNYEIITFLLAYKPKLS